MASKLGTNKVGTRSVKYEECKAVVQSLLVSAPQSLTFDQLLKDYKESEGMDLPYMALGFSNPESLLRSMKDILNMRSMGKLLLLSAASTPETEHVRQLVVEQKNAKKGGFKSSSLTRRPSPSRQRERNTKHRRHLSLPIRTPNSCNGIRQAFFVSYSIQKKVKMLLERHPCGILLDCFQELFKRSYGHTLRMPQHSDVWDLLSSLPHICRMTMDSWRNMVVVLKEASDFDYDKFSDSNCSLYWSFSDPDPAKSVGDGYGSVATAGILPSALENVENCKGNSTKTVVHNNRKVEKKSRNNSLNKTQLPTKIDSNDKHAHSQVQSSSENFSDKTSNGSMTQEMSLTEFGQLNKKSNRPRLAHLINKQPSLTLTTPPKLVTCESLVKRCNDDVQCTGSVSNSEPAEPNGEISAPFLTDANHSVPGSVDSSANENGTMQHAIASTNQVEKNKTEVLKSLTATEAESTCLSAEQIKKVWRVLREKNCRSNKKNKSRSAGDHDSEGSQVMESSLNGKSASLQSGASSEVVETRKLKTNTDIKLHSDVNCEGQENLVKKKWKESGTGVNRNTTPGAASKSCEKDFQTLKFRGHIPKKIVNGLALVVQSARNPFHINPDEILPAYKTITGENLRLCELGFTSVMDLVNAIPNLLTVVPGHFGGFSLAATAKMKKPVEQRPLQESEVRRLRATVERRPGGLSCDELLRAYQSDWPEHEGELWYPVRGYESLQDLLCTAPPDTLQCVMPTELSAQDHALGTHNLVVYPCDASLPLDSCADGAVGGDFGLDDRKRGDDFAGPECVLPPLTENPLTKVGGRLEGVAVGEVFSPRNFWVIYDKPRLDALMLDIKEYYKDHMPEWEDMMILHADCKPGLLVGANYPKDGDFYRAVVKEVKRNGKVKVFLVDYGTVFTAERYMLLYLPLQFAAQPPMALRCCLYGIGPSERNLTKWKSGATMRFLSLVSDKALTATTLGKQDKTLLLRMEDPAADGLKDLGKKLLCEQLAKPVTELALIKEESTDGDEEVCGPGNPASEMTIEAHPVAITEAASAPAAGLPSTTTGVEARVELITESDASWKRSLDVNQPHDTSSSTSEGLVPTKNLSSSASLFSATAQPNSAMKDVSNAAVLSPGRNSLPSTSASKHCVHSATESEAIEDQIEVTSSTVNNVELPDNLLVNSAPIGPEQQEVVITVKTGSSVVNISKLQGSSCQNQPTFISNPQFPDYLSKSAPTQSAIDEFFIEETQRSLNSDIVTASSDHTKCPEAHMSSPNQTRGHNRDKSPSSNDVFTLDQLIQLRDSKEPQQSSQTTPCRVHPPGFRPVPHDSLPHSDVPQLTVDGADAKQSPMHSSQVSPSSCPFSFELHPSKTLMGAPMMQQLPNAPRRLLNEPLGPLNVVQSQQQLHNQQELLQKGPIMLPAPGMVQQVRQNFPMPPGPSMFLTPQHQHLRPTLQHPHLQCHNLHHQQLQHHNLHQQLQHHNLHQQLQHHNLHQQLQHHNLHHQHLQQNCQTSPAQQVSPDSSSSKGKLQIELTLTSLEGKRSELLQQLRIRPHDEGLIERVEDISSKMRRLEALL